MPEQPTEEEVDTIQGVIKKEVNRRNPRWPEEMCKCGHQRGEHLAHFSPGHGSCTHVDSHTQRDGGLMLLQCQCEQFTWVAPPPKETSEAL